MWLGTEKYLSAPVSTTSYSTEIELPVITICHSSTEGSFGSWENYVAYCVDGKFLEEGSNLSAEDLYHKRTDQNYYRLDGTGKNYLRKNYVNIILLFQGNHTNEVVVIISYVDEIGKEYSIYVDPTTSKVLDRFGSKCASFDLESYGIRGIQTVRIEGSDICVYAHEQDKFPFKELSFIFQPTVYHEGLISASKISDQDSKKAPCYKGEDKEYLDYFC